MKKDKTTEFDRLWSVLLAAPSGEAEKNAVDAIRHYVRESEGSFSIYAVDKTNRPYDIQKASTATYEGKDIVSYEMRVEWNEGDSTGKGWKPKNKQHVYDFFLE